MVNRCVCACAYACACACACVLCVCIAKDSGSSEGEVDGQDGGGACVSRLGRQGCLFVNGEACTFEMPFSVLLVRDEGGLIK